MKDRILKILKNKKIMIPTIIIMIVFILVGMGLWFISTYFSNDIEIIEKDMEEIESKLDVQLPDLDNIDSVDSGKLEDVKTENTLVLEPTYDDIYQRDKITEDVINIVLVGLDAREYDVKSRSDTIILASYDRKAHTVKLVSFMRDSWVYIPERGWQRINSATAWGGTGALINTLNYNFNLDVQDYVEVKFDDFRKVIDILGGIDIELTQSEINYINGKLHSDDSDYSNDITTAPGMVHLNGAQALWHCRNRTIGNADFSRTERQREVLTILIDKCSHIKWKEAIELVGELRQHVNTNIPIDVMLSLCYDVLFSKALTVETTRIPFDNMYIHASKNGASVLEINVPKNALALHEFLGYDTEGMDTGDDFIYIGSTGESLEPQVPPAPNNNEESSDNVENTEDTEPEEENVDSDLEETDDHENDGEIEFETESD